MNFTMGQKLTIFKSIFLTRKLKPYRSETYHKKRNSNILEACFQKKIDLANIFGEIQDFRFSSL